MVDDDGTNARCSMRVPHEDSAIIFGAWLDLAILELKEECEHALAEKRKANEPHRS